MESKYETNAKVFQALSDPNRLKIIEMLQSRERCACEILADLKIAQSTLSHHMKILCDSGLVDSRRHGKWMYYSLSKEVCEAAKNLLAEITKIADNYAVRDPIEGC
ncbi:metalloregulator ArsR/SmtB family transcription factor [Desulfosporosinus sp. Sb-LF]|uniref:ArsR/SmtB family transcription factor n=1 Tax=Desulfosporosinus sp. Sb-LF TaxID=2560027 RepID=UPI00107EFA28|nr:metalloregulator ArsR/SmtB family transcription factor [Desulfosporosinus sp. Sb-LF]TGE33166.1 ArsR family transcriptional regulator [Desulfosporosinus sp. Sb-LF]